MWALIYNSNSQLFFFFWDMAIIRNMFGKNMKLLKSRHVQKKSLKRIHEVGPKPINSKSLEKH
jgi:hypothetical protein